MQYYKIRSGQIMVLKVVGIIGSPRKGMNTDTLVTKALEGVSSGKC